MKRPHKNAREFLLSKSKGGKRAFLCGMKMTRRLPPFDFNSNLDFENEAKKQLEQLSEEQILELKELQSKMAKLLFNRWLDEINNTN